MRGLWSVLTDVVALAWVVLVAFSLAPGIRRILGRLRDSVRAVTQRKGDQ